MVCVALIFAGAVGNILDSVFYGKIFEKSDPWDQNVAKAFPKEGGYDGFLHGQVVDMFYFPVWHGNYPNWLPAQPDENYPENDHYPSWVPRAGETFTFFSPVFNIADAAISVGVFLLIVFQRRLFGKHTKPLSARRIRATNIFFGIVAFLISTFLLLTYFTLFSSIHPLPRLKVGIVLALAAGLGYTMYDVLRRWPVFEPEIAPEIVSSNGAEKIAEANHAAEDSSTDLPS